MKICVSATLGGVHFGESTPLKRKTQIMIMNKEGNGNPNIIVNEKDNAGVGYVRMVYSKNCIVSN